MRLATDHMSADLPCYRCGYDLRAHEQGGKCPECGMSVAESRRLAAVPPRPAWADSDPVWRRRMLAGAWVLAFLPLMDTLNTSGWASSVPVPHIFDFCDPANTLDGRLLSYDGFFPAIMFCIGMVLLFSPEQGRRRSWLDWTSRWGVICCYVVLLLYFTQLLFLAAQVLVGVAALFQSIPLKYQPGAIHLLMGIGASYLRYGPSPSFRAFGFQIIFSAITVLLACFPLFNALRSCGSKAFATVLLLPLIVFALIQIVQGARHSAGNVNYLSTNIFFCSVYFWPEAVLRNFADPSLFLYFEPPSMVASFAEAAKWCIVLTIAIWLSIAQVLAWRRHRRSLVWKRPDRVDASILVKRADTSGHG